ncbi:hypothetical protein ACFL35_15055 [Candidatus Riflebacteria bacterium]
MKYSSNIRPSRESKLIFSTEYMCSMIALYGTFFFLFIYLSLKIAPIFCTNSMQQVWLDDQKFIQKEMKKEEKKNRLTISEIDNLKNATFFLAKFFAEGKTSPVDILEHLEKPLAEKKIRLLNLSCNRDRNTLYFSCNGLAKSLAEIFEYKKSLSDVNSLKNIQLRFYERKEELGIKFKMDFSVK